MSVDPLALAADRLDPLVPQPRTDGRDPVVVPGDLGRLAVVAAILRDVGALPTVAASGGVDLEEFERLAAHNSELGRWW
jgi:hypothetical protein